MNEPYERTKQLIDLAITAGRARQSPQTGWVHYCYNLEDESFHHTIPVLENLLFVLALFRTRNSDNINEAKKLLEQLLSFQNRQAGESLGNFPIYLHEYPHCKDRWLAAHILPVLFWMQKNFSIILGNDLRGLLAETIRFSLEYSLKKYAEKKPPFQAAIKIAAAAKAFGDYWDTASFSQEGERLLGQLLEESQESVFGSWCSPAYIADTLTALLMVYPDLTESPWTAFWKYVGQTWDDQARSYMGPSVKEGQDKEEPLVTLYDIYLGYLTGNYSYRALCDHPMRLHAALVHAVHEHLHVAKAPFDLQGSLAGLDWIIHKKQDFSLSAIRKYGKQDPAFEKYFQPFKLLWGSQTQTHSLVCQEGNFPYFEYSLAEGGIDLFFYLTEPQMTDDKEKGKEISLFTNIQEGAAITVANKAANTFLLNDWLQYSSAGLNLAMQFQLLEGTGRFFGHIMRGNRPSQIANKGENRYKAFDWQIFLRSVRRPQPCKILCSIRIL